MFLFRRFWRGLSDAVWPQGGKGGRWKGEKNLYLPFPKGDAAEDEMDGAPPTVRNLMLHSQFLSYVIADLLFFSLFLPMGLLFRISLAYKVVPDFWACHPPLPPSPLHSHLVLPWPVCSRRRGPHSTSYLPGAPVPRHSHSRNGPLCIYRVLYYSRVYQEIHLLPLTL